MTGRGFITLLFGAVSVVIALSTGNEACLLIGVIALSALVVMFLSILLPFLTLRISQQLEENEVLRLGRCHLTTRISLFSLLPIAPFLFTVQLPSGRSSTYLLHPRMIGQTKSSNEFTCPHVGVFSVGLSQVTCQDSLGLFRFTRRIHKALPILRILPKAAAVSPVPVRPGTEDGPASAYTTTDYTTPEGIRNWMEGDELKRVHWKLSARRQTLLVRTYEQLERPDTLILLNTGGVDPSALHASSIIDALTESCAGAVASLLSENRPVCLPIPAANSEIRGENMRVFPDVQRYLSQLVFTEEDHFPEVLEVAAPRLQRSDMLLIFSPVITPAITDEIIRLSQFGSSIRFTLAAQDESDAGEMKLLQLLVAANIETFQVTIS